jgi:uncharacterized membrane protein YdfJ with MMPL/SSD domain
MKRPLLIIVGTVTLLLALASPALDAKFSQVDDRVLPASNPAAIASDQIRERFESQIPVEVLVPISVSIDEVNDYAKELVADPNVISALTGETFIEGEVVDRGVEESNSFHGASPLSDLLLLIIGSCRMASELRWVQDQV